MALGSATACSITLNTSLTAEQRERYQNSRAIRQLLKDAKTIAIVGASTEKTKASNMVASYLQDEGYRIVPINPRAEEILGEKCYPDLKSIPFPVDIVDIFRPPAEIAAIVEEAILIKPKAIWMQLRLIDLAAADRAIAAGINVIADRCIKMEHARYAGALHWAGMNTEVITAQRRRRA